jgi:2-polyprenyl-3-methyl-5-hydroxy-6-metoxy-1,4-benzoquinol methylase
MGFIILQSDNPDFSYIIRKNPETSPHTRQVRKGVCIGWFDPKNINCYVVKFSDISESVSFPKNSRDDYDYLPYMQYGAPILLTCVSKEMFGTVLNQGEDRDKPNKCSISQGIMKINKKSLNLIEKMNKYINKYDIKLDPTNVSDLYKFSILSDNSTISQLLQYAYILGYTLNCMTFGSVEKPDSSVLDKIIKIMNSINVPYYIRYLFKNYMIGREIFVKVKKELEFSKDYDIKMVFGNTQQQRCDFISKSVLDFYKSTINNIHIVDIGCGEGYYVRNLLELLDKKKNYNFTYHCHDIDNSEMDKIDQLIKTDNIYSKVQSYRSIDDMIKKLSEFKDESILVLFSEVIEHIPLDKIKEFMIKIISDINFKKMIITTPSYEFNVHYMMNPDEFRHPDHKQEFTKKQFTEFMDDVVLNTNKKPNVIYSPVGDCIDNIGMSQCIELVI